MNKKRAICLILTVLLAFSLCLLCGCEEEKQAETDKSTQTDKTESIDKDTEESKEEIAEESFEYGTDDSSEDSTPTLEGVWYKGGNSLMLNGDGGGIYCVNGELFNIQWTETDGVVSFTAEDEGVPLPTGGSVSFEGGSLVLGDEVYTSAPTMGEGDLDPRLFGTWYTYGAMGEEITVFNEDGSGTISSIGEEMAMTWYIADGKLNIVMDIADGISYTVTCDSYSVVEDELTLVMMGETGVFTRTRKPLGGDEALVGTWEPEEVPDRDNYFELGEDGSGAYYSYTEEDVSKKLFTWAEADGTVTLDVYTYDTESFEEIALGQYSFTYTFSGENLVINYEDAETVYKPYEYDSGYDIDSEARGGDEALVGKWNDGVGVTILNADGTAEYNLTYEGEDSFIEEYSFDFGYEEYESEYYWYVKDDILVIYEQFEEDEYVDYYGTYFIEGDTLYVFNGMSFNALTMDGSAATAYYGSVYSISEEDMEMYDDYLFCEGDPEGEPVDIYFSETVTDFKYVSVEGETESTLYSVDSVEGYLSFITYIDGSEANIGYGIEFTDSNGKHQRLMVCYDEEIDEYYFASCDA